ncbi:MAG: protein kinase [Actinobacteria bacterium]|nr:protein kinase [Actinomycetota bacterium]
MARSAHRVGILHRDLKPANILISEWDEPGLTDFGLAARGVHGEQAALSLPWVPPEVLDEIAPDERGDVYSLAATLYTLIEGHPPYVEPGLDNPANTDDLVFARTLQGPLPAFRTRQMPQLASALLAGMARDRDARPSSALQFGHSLQAVQLALGYSKTPLSETTQRGSSVTARAETTGDALDAGATRHRDQVHADGLGAIGTTRHRSEFRSGEVIIDGLPVIAVPSGEAPVAPARPEQPSVVLPAADPSAFAPSAPAAVEADRPRRVRLLPIVGAAAVAAGVVMAVVLGAGGGTPDDRGSDEYADDTIPTLGTAVVRPQDIDVVSGQVTWSYASADAPHVTFHLRWTAADGTLTETDHPGGSGTAAEETMLYTAPVPAGPGCADVTAVQGEESAAAEEVCVG